MKSITDILIDFEVNLKELKNQQEKQEVIDMVKRTNDIINSDNDKESHDIQNYLNIMYNANVLTINDLKHIDKKCAQHYYDNVLTAKNI